MKIAFLGYGEAARAFHEGLARPGVTFIAYDILLDRDDQSIVDDMEARGAQVARDIAVLAEADWIFSAVTADQSLVAVEPLLPHLRQGQVVIDINSVSPSRKKKTSVAIEAAGAIYLDMAVMAPVHPRKHQTPVLIAGRHAEQLAANLTSFGFSLSIAGLDPGAATAVKMVRSLFVKGLEAITVETFLAAEASGCFDEILASLSGSFPGLDWPVFAEYQFERTTTHGRRRAAEMIESAATLDELGLNCGLARAISEVQDATGNSGAAKGDSLRDTVQQTLARRLAT